jgi:hypothetical protein
LLLSSHIQSYVVGATYSGKTPLPTFAISPTRLARSHLDGVAVGLVWTEYDVAICYVKATPHKPIFSGSLLSSGILPSRQQMNGELSVRRWPCHGAQRVPRDHGMGRPTTSRISSQRGGNLPVTCSQCVLRPEINRQFPLIVGHRSGISFHLPDDQFETLKGGTKGLVVGSRQRIEAHCGFGATGSGHDFMSGHIAECANRKEDNESVHRLSHGKRLFVKAAQIHKVLNVSSLRMLRGERVRVAWPP